MLTIFCDLLCLRCQTILKRICPWTSPKLAAFFSHVAIVFQTLWDTSSGCAICKGLWKDAPWVLESFRVTNKGHQWHHGSHHFFATHLSRLPNKKEGFLPKFQSSLDFAAWATKFPLYWLLGSIPSPTNPKKQPSGALSHGSHDQGHRNGPTVIEYHVPIKSIYFQKCSLYMFRKKKSYIQPVSALALSICISPTWSLKTSYAPQDANGQQSPKGHEQENKNIEVQGSQWLQVHLPTNLVFFRICGPMMQFQQHMDTKNDWPLNCAQAYLKVSIYDKLSGYPKISSRIYWYLKVSSGYLQV